MRIQPVKLLLRILKIIPATSGPAKTIDKADKTLDKYSDRCREKRAKLIKKIKAAGKVVVFMAMCLVLQTGCQTVKDLRGQGYKVSKPDAVLLNYYDAVIKADEAVDSVIDYDVEIGK